MRRLPLIPLLLLVVLSGAATLGGQEEEETVLGSSSTLRIDPEAGETVSIEAGTRLHESPHLHSPGVTVVDVTMPLTVLEQRSDWVKVRYGERQGWAFLGELPALPPPTLEPPPPVEAPPAVEPVRPDPDRLARALALLDAEAAATEMGAITVYTDVPKRRVRDIVVAVAEHLPKSYDRRYGLPKRREAEFAVVIFAREEAYREFEQSVGELPEVGGQGHAGSGVAALVAGQRTPPEVAALLVHELAHLLNRRTFEGDLPPWLEEGIANDLAYCKVRRDGELEPSTLGGRSFIAEVPGPSDRFGRRRFAGTFHLEGPLASLSLLKRSVAAGETMPLPQLLDLTWREFVDPDGRELRYVQSTFLIRYLLDELEGDGFLDFLRQYQSGGSAEPAALLSALDMTWEELTEGYEGWINVYSGRS